MPATNVNNNLFFYISQSIMFYKILSHVFVIEAWYDLSSVLKMAETQFWEAKQSLQRHAAPKGQSKG